MNKIKIIKMLGKSFAMASIILLIFALLAPVQASYNQTDNGLMSEVNVTKKNETHIIHVPTDYPTIQEAIDNASSGDVIHVEGVYNDTDPSKGIIKIIGRKNIRIIGEGAEIRYRAPSISANVINITNSSDITISGFKMDKVTPYHQDPPASTVKIERSTNVEIAGCNIKIAGDDYAMKAIYIVNSKHVSITGCRIEDNFQGCGHFRALTPVAITLDNSTVCNISGNFITACGIRPISVIVNITEDSRDNLIINNTFSHRSF